MKGLVAIVKKEPLALAALSLSILQFVYPIVAEYYNTDVEYAFECSTPDSTEIELEGGFIFYVAECDFTNRSLAPVSISRLDSVMLSGLSVANSIFIPKMPVQMMIDHSPKIAKTQEGIPIYLRPRETVRFAALFYFHVGLVNLIGAKECAESADGSSEPSLGDICFSDGSRKNLKEAIYGGLNFDLDYANNFGIRLTLSTLQEVILEADLTKIYGNRCDETIQQLACNSFSRVPSDWEIQSNWIEFKIKILGFLLSAAFTGLVFLFAASSVFLGRKVLRYVKHAVSYRK